MNEGIKLTEIVFFFWRFLFAQFQFESKKILAISWLVSQSRTNIILSSS